MMSRIIVGAILSILIVGFMVKCAPAHSHEWFGNKFVQASSEWTAAQFGGPGNYQPEPPPPLRPGEEWLNGKAPLDSPTGATNCCNGKDCWEIEDSEWWLEGSYYHVIRDGVTYTIPERRAQPSESKKGKAAACIHNGALLCFFVPLSY